MALIDIKVPDIGDFAEVTVIELMVKAGDTIKPEQSLITVESEKASMTGTLRSTRNMVLRNNFKVTQATRGRAIRPPMIPATIIAS